MASSSHHCTDGSDGHMMRVALAAEVADIMARANTSAMCLMLAKCIYSLAAAGHLDYS